MAVFKLKRGLESSLTAGKLSDGELGFTTDTNKLYIGKGGQNILLVNTSSSGDMQKSIYDTDNDGVVDRAELADSVAWTGVTGKPATYPPETHNHDTAYLPKDTALTWNDLMGT